MLPSRLRGGKVQCRSYLRDTGIDLAQRSRFANPAMCLQVVFLERFGRERQPSSVTGLLQRASRHWLAQSSE